MSQAHIEKFYAIASKDDALLAKMMAGTNGPEDFVANAVKEGNVLGYTFTAEEGSAWIKQQQDIKDLQVGDEVLTTSGFLGTVTDVAPPPTFCPIVRLNVAELLS